MTRLARGAVRAGGLTPDGAWLSYDAPDGGVGVVLADDALPQLGAVGCDSDGPIEAGESRVAIDAGTRFELGTEELVRVDSVDAATPESVFGLDRPAIDVAATEARVEALLRVRPLLPALPDARIDGSFMVLPSGSNTTSLVDDDPADLQAALIAPWSETSDLAALGAAFTHRLREPLHAIRMFNGALQRRVPEEFESTREIDRAARNLAGVFRELEEYLCAPPATAVRMSSDSVDALVERIASDGAEPVPVHRTAEDAGIDAIRIDVDSFSRVVRELVDNAVRHGQGKRGVTWSVEHSMPFLHVWDEGSGFPADKGASVFLPLVCGQGAGPGLGLAWVNRLVHQVNGVIRAGLERDRFTLSIGFCGAPRV